MCFSNFLQTEAKKHKKMKDIRKEERPIPISFITQFQNDMVDKRDRFGDEYYDHVIEGIAELLKRWKKEKGKYNAD